MCYDEYAEQCTEELVKLIHMMNEGKKVYLFFWGEGKGECELLELGNFLNKLSSSTLSRVIDLSEEQRTRGRRPTKIPLKVVQDKLKEGWTFKRIYQFLVERGYLRYKERGEEKILTYKQFCYRLNKMGIQRATRGENSKLASLILHRRKDIVRAYEEFKRITDERAWSNVDLFMSFLEGKGLISRDSITRNFIERLMVILRRNSGER